MISPTFFHASLMCEAVNIWGTAFNVASRTTSWSSWWWLDQKREESKQSEESLVIFCFSPAKRMLSSGCVKCEVFGGRNNKKQSFLRAFSIVFVWRCVPRLSRIRWFREVVYSSMFKQFQWTSSKQYPKGLSLEVQKLNQVSESLRESWGCVFPFPPLVWSVGKESQHFFMEFWINKQEAIQCLKHSKRSHAANRFLGLKVFTPPWLWPWL